MTPFRHHTESSFTDTPLRVDLIDPPDLTEALQRDKKRIIGHGSFGTVYRCSCTHPENGKEFLVAVKAITFSLSLSETEMGVFKRKMKRELGIWRRLDHPNIVPLLGTACGGDFGSDHPCMVAMWMTHGTLIDYVKQCGPTLSLPNRIQLVKGSVAGLEYLHSKSLVHGDFHPGNILIDDEHNARLADFGFSQTLCPMQDQLSYLWTDSIRPGAVMWAAPELLYPHLYPDLEMKATLNSDIYSLGSITLFILSGRFPWLNRGEAENKLREFQNPPRPIWPANIPDDVWNFVERCWSPRFPRQRPSAQEVLSFAGDRLEQLLKPNSASSDINVVLFGALGCGKSSIINLLSGKPIAQVSMDVNPCTKQPQYYEILIGERRFWLWDTMGFGSAHEGDVSHLSPYEQAYAVLRDLPGGVNLILLCARKDGISHSLGSLYWLINDFFFGGHAPVAFIVTNFDTPDKRWWERNRHFITTRTNIPAESIPHECITTIPTGCDQSKQTLEALLENYATTVPPIPLCLNLSSHERTSLNIASRFGLDSSEAAELVEKFSRPRRPVNVVVFGKAGAGKSSVINLIAGKSVAQVTSDVESCTLVSKSHLIDIPKKQCRISVWDTLGFMGVHKGRDMTRKAVLNAVQLVRDLSGQGGIGLLVFVKKYGKLTPSEQHCYRLFEGFLCKGQVPVALIITHLDDQEPMGQWWEMNGEDMLNLLSGNVMGHACITCPASYHPEDRKVLESKRAVQAILERHVSFPQGEGFSDRLSTEDSRETGRVTEMTVENLMTYCGLTEELAKELMKSYNSSGRSDGLRSVGEYP